MIVIKLYNITKAQSIFQDRAVKNFEQVHVDFGRRLRAALSSFEHASKDVPRHLKDGGWN